MPPRVTKSSWVPISEMVPRSSTTMRSALRTVERRCAITSTVRPAIRLMSALCTSISDSVSSADEGDARARAAGKALAALADNGIVALRHFHDEIMRQSCARGPFDKSTIHIILPVCDIAEDRIVKQHRLLGHHANLRPQ